MRQKKLQNGILRGHAVWKSQKANATMPHSNTDITKAKQSKISDKHTNHGNT